MRREVISCRFCGRQLFFDAKSKLSVNLSLRERRWERLSSDATAAAAAAAAMAS